MSKWTKWQGGERPVGFWDRVRVLLRFGVVNEGDANSFSWVHTSPPDNDCNIVAYRVLPPLPPLRKKG